MRQHVSPYILIKMCEDYALPKPSQKLYPGLLARAYQKEASGSRTYVITATESNQVKYLKYLNIGFMILELSVDSPK